MWKKTMILCKHCGARIAGNSCFCGICGQITEDIDDKPTRFSKWNSVHTPHPGPYTSTTLDENEYAQTEFATQPLPTEILPATRTGKNSDSAYVNGRSQSRIWGYLQANRRKWLLVLLILLLLSASIGGLDFTIPAPVLTLGRNAMIIAQGSVLQLHGYNFLPRTSITLTLDNTQTLRITQQFSAREHRHHGTLTAIAGLPESTPQAGQTAITTGEDGSFIANIAVGSNWHTGQHTITASEMSGWHRASISFKVTNAEQDGGQSTATPTNRSPGRGANSSSFTATLSSISPSTVTLGPTQENSNQAVSSRVTLNTSGTGTVSWSASWDHMQASWLQLAQSSGNIQAPGSQIIMLQAQSSGLQVGSYSTTVTFTASPGQQTLALIVNLIVQSDCASAGPILLNFKGIAGVSDPPPQAISPLNCLPPGNWSSTTTTSNGGNWLSINPAGGTLTAGNAQIITISVSNRSANLPVGIYLGAVIFSTASAQVMVDITLTVQAQPARLIISPGALNVRSNCQHTTTGWTCTAYLSSENAQANLAWSANSTFVVQPAQGLLTPDIAITVVIDVPATCSTTTNITFNGPDTTTTLVLNCT
jgi:hypothetical protein